MVDEGVFHCNLSLSVLGPPPGFHHLQGHQQAKGTLSKVSQPMGSGSYVPHLMFSPHSPRKEIGIFDYQEENDKFDKTKGPI